MNITNLATKAQQRLRRVDGKMRKPKEEKKPEKPEKPERSERTTSTKRAQGEEPSNPFYSPRSAARWKENMEREAEAKRRFDQQFPPQEDQGPRTRNARRQSYEEDHFKSQRKENKRAQSQEWDNADFGSSRKQGNSGKKAKPPTKLPEPTNPSDEEFKEIKATLMDNLSLPLAQRKVFFKELQRDLHPDKSDKENATQLFQFLMSNKGWFLLGPKPGR